MFSTLLAVLKGVGRIQLKHQHFPSSSDCIVTTIDLYILSGCVWTLVALNNWFKANQIRQRKRRAQRRLNQRGFMLVLMTKIKPKKTP